MNKRLTIEELALVERAMDVYADYVQETDDRGGESLDVIIGRLDAISVKLHAIRSEESSRA